MTNILQHKSWNVWNRDNRAKVEKDVAAHKEAEEKKRKRILEIEQEIRYTELKEKNKKRKEENDEDDPDSYKRATAVVPYKETPEGDEKPQHINFFADIEAGNGQLVAGDKNADYEAEQKAEKEKEDRKNTNYLVPPQTSDFKVVAPWYAQTPTGTSEVVLPEPQKTDKEAKEAELKKKKDERLKNKEDPLQAMNKYLGAKKQAKKIKKEQEKVDNKASSIQKMREERLQREAEERKKVSQLLYGNKDQKSSGPPSNSSGYNNSFINYSGGVLRDPQYRRGSNEQQRGNRY